MTLSAGTTALGAGASGGQSPGAPAVLPTRGGGAVPRRSRRRSVERKEGAGAAFAVPFLIVFLLTMIVPVGYAVYESLYKTTLFGGTSFAGFANYSQTFSSSDFWGGVERVAIFAAVQVPLTLALAFFFAAIFDLRVVKFAPFFRLVFFVPYAVPAVVAAIMWSFLLVPQYGTYTKLAGALGAPGTDFFSTDLILPTIIVIVIWEVMGYNMVIFFTALKSVPHQVVEAAVLDGASLWSIIFRVKLPMVRSAVVMLTFLNLIGALQLFTEPSIISTFEPQAIPFGFTPTLYIYNTSIGSGEYNLGAAAAVVFAGVIALVSIGSLLVARRGSATA